tara:strand:- start:51 stop:320 length:270 start_codon:yes stop_codon:yes gene_type:complete
MTNNKKNFDNCMNSIIECRTFYDDNKWNDRLDDETGYTFISNAFCNIRVNKWYDNDSDSEEEDPSETCIICIDKYNYMETGKCCNLHDV